MSRKKRAELVALERRVAVLERQLAVFRWFGGIQRTLFLLAMEPMKIVDGQKRERSLPSNVIPIKQGLNR